MKRLFDETEDNIDIYNVKTFEERELSNCNSVIKTCVFSLIATMILIFVIFVCDDFYLRLHTRENDVISATLVGFQSEYKSTIRGRVNLINYSLFEDAEGNEYKLKSTYKDKRGREIEIYRIDKHDYVRKNWELKRISYTDVVALMLFGAFIIMNLSVIFRLIKKKQHLQNLIETKKNRHFI